MNALEISVIAIIGFLVIVMIFNLFKEYQYMKIIESVKKTFAGYFHHGEVIEHNQEHFYHVEFKDGRTYLIKLVIMNPKHELIITNSDNVVINDNIRGWQRSTKPHTIFEMKEFIRYKKEDKSIIKIVLIYPNCHNITKYTNESDCYIVPEFKKVDGLYFIRYNQLINFLKKQ